MSCFRRCPLRISPLARLRSVFRLQRLRELYLFQFASFKQSMKCRTTGFVIR
uniref:Uncharacterized protein n=1 Tax=Lepeophtheirus salmonis TaxID=72036 RepID=A0A0K2VBB6_LEPSM